MIRAVWDGIVLAEAAETVMVEGNHYFAPEDLAADLFERSRRRTLCPWKGVARYYDVTIDDRRLPDAAWYYPRPTPPTRSVKNRVAFSSAVAIERAPRPRTERT